MGSSQSSPETTPTGASIGQVTEDTPAEESSTRNGTKESTKQLTGFAHVQHLCQKKKRSYDKCYAKWYSGSFITGKNVNFREESCDDLFEAWRECILRGMKQDRETRGLGPPAENSMLGEVMEEEDDDQE